MSRATYTVQQFIKAIPGSGGIIATIAERVGCSWNTAKKYVDTKPTVSEVYQDECERIDDMAVSIVLKAIREGDVSTAKWWLSKKRRQTFGENIDISSTGEPIQFIIKNVSDTD